jgi:hypothetical protein
VSSWFLTVKNPLRDDGAAAVPFILALPIFLIILGILIQYALIVNAKIVITNAAQAAARSAVTSLPEGRPENVERATYMSLASISPRAQMPVRPEGERVYQAMLATGLQVLPSFAERYTYAMEAADVSCRPADLSTSRARELDVTVRYRFYLTVPGALRLIGNADTVAGIRGRYIDIVSTNRVESSHSRQANAGGGGWPQ